MCPNNFIPSYSLGASPRFQRVEGSKELRLQDEIGFDSSRRFSPSTRLNDIPLSFSLSPFSTLRHSRVGRSVGLSYQPRLQTLGRDPRHHQLPRHLLSTCSWWRCQYFSGRQPPHMAHVARLSRASVGWTCTTFRCNQDIPAFPPGIRVLLARLLFASMARRMG